MTPPNCALAEFEFGKVTKNLGRFLNISWHSLYGKPLVRVRWQKNYICIIIHVAHWSIYLSFFDAYIERRRGRRRYRISLAKLPSCSNYSVPVITICDTECLVLTLADLVSCWAMNSSLFHFGGTRANEPIAVSIQYSHLPRLGSHRQPLVSPPSYFYGVWSHTKKKAEEFREKWLSSVFWHTPRFSNSASVLWVKASGRPSLWSLWAKYLRKPPV